MQAIPVAVSPILTRLYTPKEFGLYALFVSIAAIVASVAGGRYELAVMLPKSDSQALNIVFLALLIVTSVSLAMLLFMFFFNVRIAEWLGNKAIAPWLYLTPASVFFLGVFNSLKLYHSRLKQYRAIASVSIGRALVMSVTQVVSGMMKSGVLGLILGAIFSSFFSAVVLFKNARIHFSDIRFLKMIALAKRYRDFPKFSMGAALANALSSHLSMILISAIFSVTTLGFYALVQRVLALPSALIGTSVGQVFFQQATEERKRTGHTDKIFGHTVKKLLLVSLPVFGVLFLIIEDLFAIVFGEPWRIAGSYAQILVPMFAIQFVSASVALITSVYERQKESLFINLILLSASIVVLLFAYSFALSFEHFLMLFSVTLSGCYLGFLFYYAQLSKKGSK